MKLDPRLRSIAGYFLIGSGALTATSGVVNIIAAWKLIDAATAASLGVSRREFVETYAGFLIVGAVLIFAGWKVKKPARR